LAAVFCPAVLGGTLELEGVAEEVSGDVVVAFDRFLVGGVNLGTPTLTFEPVAE
jgi:hypothetical protein